MKRKMSLLVMAMSIIAASLLLNAPSSAQSIWLNRHDNLLALEIAKPDFKRYFRDFQYSRDYSFTTAALFLSLRSRLGDKAILVVELPFAHSKYEAQFGSSRLENSESTIGNPYLGIEIPSAFPFFAELGVRVPLVSEDKGSAVQVGQISEIDHFEAFLPDYLTINGAGNYDYTTSFGFRVRFRSGLALLINTGDQYFEDGLELLLGYSAQAGYESKQVSLMGGFSGKALLTADSFDYSNQSLHQLGFVASLGAGRLRPSVYFKLPVGENYRYRIDFVFGLNLGIQLK